MPSDLDTETRALLRMLLYGVIFENAPGEEAAKRIIEVVVDAPPGPFGSGPGPSRDKYRAAIGRALASTDPLTDLADNARPDAVTRSFLAAVLRRLDAEAITRTADDETGY
jgi:hypothetical protein